MNPEKAYEDLNSFREAWRAEVRARHVAAGSSQQQQPQQQQQQHPNAPERGEPVSALEHYEKAVEREAAGNMGDSLRLYMKAFKMDDRVDQLYRTKHFPKPPPKPAQEAPTKDAQESAGSASKPEQPQSMTDLIDSFSAATITPAPPPVEGMPPLPSPLASLPEEILVHILRDLATADVGSFVRLAQSCKRLAYLVLTEDSVWRRICLGPEFGFGGMHYHWQCQVAWGPLSDADIIREAEEAASAPAPTSASASADPSETTPSPPAPVTLSERDRQHAQESEANTLAFYHSLYSGSWQRMFRLRPRIRFNGCYISTVNYVRSGQASHNAVSWHSPVHIVTYYRYLRFFRDGTVMSLLTTAEPVDVVHHLTREAAAQHAGGQNPRLPSAVVQSVLKGRWRLARAADNPGAPPGEVEGDVMIETEGVSNYIYRLNLALTAARKNARNNKMVWKGFYNYSPLTGEWAEFPMRDSKPFYFSRVKSYGVMGA